MHLRCISAITCMALLGMSGFAIAAMEKAITGLNAPTGIISGADGRLYVSEWGEDRVLAVDGDGRREVIATSVPGAAGLALDPAGTLYMAGYGDGTIYALDRHGLRKHATGLANPTGLLWSRDNTLLVANRGAGNVIKIFADGSRQTVSAGHTLPVGIAETKDGSLFVSCYGGGVDIIKNNGERLRVDTGLSTPGTGIVPIRRDAVMVVDHGADALLMLDADGHIDRVVDGLPSPVGLGMAANGNLLVSCWGDGAIHEFDARPEW